MSYELLIILRKRFHNYRIARYILYITTLWAISIFLAPLTLESHTVEDLDGNANWVDYNDKWVDMATYNPYAAMVYLFGDFNCHQKSSRSFTYHENQLPVDARMVGIALGAALASPGLFFVIRTPNIYLTFLSLVPDRIRRRLLSRLSPLIITLIVGLLFMLPTGFDGFRQLLTSYESTNIVRIISGFLLGIILTWSFGSAFLSMTIPITQYTDSNKNID